jgi:hypothetical protein
MMTEKTAVDKEADAEVEMTNKWKEIAVEKQVSEQVKSPSSSKKTDVSAISEQLEWMYDDTSIQ